MKTKYQIINHDYINTGGNCMVSVFDVHFKAENVTRFVNVSDEYITLTTIDIINFDNDIDDYSAVTIDEANIRELNSTQTVKHLDLFKYCLIEHLKKDCKHCDTFDYVLLEWLPDDFIKTKLNNKYEVEYLIETHDGMLKTNGYFIYLPKSDCTVEYLLLDCSEHKELHGEYVPGYDHTFVMESTYVAGECVSTECVGWYCGEPDDVLIKQYANRHYKAEY